MNDVNIWQYIEKSFVLNLTKALVQMPSYTGLEAQEKTVAEYIDSILKDNGIESKLVEVVENRFNVIAKLSGDRNGKKLLLNGHLDTVPAYGMKDAFTPRIEKGKLYGRGSVDMKGPVASMLSAIIALRRMHFPLNGEVYFSGVIDEEEKSLGSIHLIENLPAHFDGVIVGEPTDLNICVAHRGLQWIEVAIHGKTVHGGHQSEGLNAISLAGLFIPYIESRMAEFIETSSHPIIGQGSFNIGTISGGTQPSTVAGDCVIRFDRRWLPSENLALIMKQLEMIVKDFSKMHPKYEITFHSMPESIMSKHFVHESMDTSVDTDIVKATAKAVESVLNQDVVLTYFPAWSDGGLLHHFGKMPCIVLGPGRLDSAHSDEEFIEVESLYKGVEVYAESIIEFLNYT